MGKRRDGRILAVQFLYQIGSSTPEDTMDALSLFWDLTEAQDGLKKFARPRIDGVLAHREELDGYISKAAEKWDLNRIAPVDQCILRLALWEMFYDPGVPPVVAINEAVEIAKSLSTEKSGQFVNGILDRIHRDHRAQLSENTS